MVRVQLQPLGNIAIVGPNVLGGQELSGLREKKFVECQPSTAYCYQVQDNFGSSYLYNAEISLFYLSILFAHRMKETCPVDCEQC